MLSKFRQCFSRALAVIFFSQLLVSSHLVFAASFKNSLSVYRVYIPRGYSLLNEEGNNSHYQQCPQFKGTYDGSTITFKMDAVGGQGSSTHTLVYQFNDSYKLSDTQAGTLNKKYLGRHLYAQITLPVLKDHVPYVNQTVMLLSKDSEGHIAQSTLNFTVSRDVVLTRTQNQDADEKNCFQRYPAYESVASMLSNGSTNISKVEIVQGAQKIFDNRRGHRFGVFFSPTAVFSYVGNILAFNYNYFRETSKQVTETVEVSSEYNLSPGDYFQIYTQPTRFITAYDATLVKPCGQKKRLENAYMFQWWGYAYHVHPVNPSSSSGRVDRRTVGAPVQNTCGEEFSDEFHGDSDYEFRSTNQ